MSIKNIKEKYKSQVKEAVTDLKSKDKEKVKKQIPNLITASRLFAPLFIIPPAIVGNLPLAGALTCIFAASDGVDGFLARKWNATSDLGRDLDAFTDKVFAGTLLITLSFFNPMLLTTLGLEATIGGINAYSKVKGLEPRTEMIGKVKTASLSALLLASFVTPFVNLPEPLIPNLFALTTALQAVTAGAYISQYKKKKERKDKLDAIKEITSEDEIQNDEKKENKKSNEKVLEKEQSINSNVTKKEYESLRKLVEEKSKDEVLEEKVIEDEENKVIKKSRKI